MKKFLFFLLLVPFLFGCETYEDYSNPQLNINGSWRIINVQADYSDDVKVENGDYFAVSPLIVLSSGNNGWLVQNDTTDISPCYFYKNGYRWDFDYNNLILKNDRGQIIAKYYVSFGNTFYNPGDFTLTDQYTNQPIGGVFHMTFNANGVMPASDLWITVPVIEFNLSGPERSMDRFISQEITLKLTR
jgi:hypothetical protein